MVESVIVLTGWTIYDDDASLQIRVFRWEINNLIETFYSNDLLL